MVDDVPVWIKKQTEKFLKSIDNEIKNYHESTTFQKSECRSSKQNPEMSISYEQFSKLQNNLTTKQMNDIFGEDENYWLYKYSDLVDVEDELITVKKLKNIYETRIKALESLKKERSP